MNACDEAYVVNPVGPTQPRSYGCPIADARVAFVGAPGEVMLIYQSKGVYGELPNRVWKVRGLL